MSSMNDNRDDDVAVPSKDLHSAMVALRQGKITPDEFRAIMRKSREANGAKHDAVKFNAARAFSS